MTLTHLDSIHILILHTSAWWPDVYHQFTWQLELLSLGLDFTHLQFSLSFSDKPRFLPTLAFFSDNVFLWQPHSRQVELSTFQLWYCLWLSNRCSLYIGGSGCTRLGRWHCDHRQRKSNCVTLQFTAPQWFPIILKTLLPALKHGSELMSLLLQNLTSWFSSLTLPVHSDPLFALMPPRAYFCSKTLG